MHTYPKSVSGQYLLTALLDLDNISHNCCSWPKGVSWPWPKVTSLRPRSQSTHTQNLCPGHKSSLPCWIWIIFHTCPWLKGMSWPWPEVIPRSSRSQCTHSWNPYLGHNSLLSRRMRMILVLHLIVANDKGSVVTGGICPVRTGLVYHITCICWINTVILMKILLSVSLCFIILKLYKL